MQTKLAGKKIAILVASGFEEAQMTGAQKALLALGATVRIVSTDAGLVNGWHGTSWGHYYPVDLQIGDCLASDFDMVVLPGGSRSITKLAASPHTKRILSSFLLAAKPVAALGAGVDLLAHVGEAAARTLAGGDAELLTRSGAFHSEEALLRSENLLTGTDAALADFLVQLPDLFDAADSGLQNAA